MEWIKPRHKALDRPHVADRLELQEQVTELAAQQAAMSEVLRSIANSPHELKPIFDTISAAAVRLFSSDYGPGLFPEAISSTSKLWSAQSDLARLNCSREAGAVPSRA
jgi:hypothetical protein